MGPRSKAARKRRLARALSRNEILSHAQVKETVRLIRAQMGPEWLAFAEKLSFDFGDSVRLGSLRARIAAARESRGLTIKQVATELHLSQYRVKAAERGSPREMRPEVAQRHIEFLGLRRWARRWATANPILAKRIGLAPASVRSSRQGRPAR